jgi:hypothetical protein
MDNYALYEMYYKQQQKWIELVQYALLLTT